MDSAMGKAMTCDLESNSDSDYLSSLYRNSTRKYPIVDPLKVSVGEVLFNATASSSIREAMIAALNGWRVQCLFLEYFSGGCDTSGVGRIQDCNNCRRC